MKRWLWAALFGAACAHAPPPRVLGATDEVRQSPAVVEAKQMSPQAYLHAERLRTRAEQAYAGGDIAGSQILSERALAAYQRAVVLTRIVKASERRSEAQERLRRAEATLAKLDRDQQLATAQADQAELELKVAKDAVTRTPSAPATGEREQARRQAARSLLAQAKMLCVAARLINPNADGVATALTELNTLAGKLAGSPVPIDEATSLRAKCLLRLTQARRPAATRAPAAGLADALLAELGRSGDLMPFRDDRGVVVTLRDLFFGGRRAVAGRPPASGGAGPGGSGASRLSAARGGALGRFQGGRPRGEAERLPTRSRKPELSEWKSRAPARTCPCWTRSGPVLAHGTSASSWSSSHLPRSRTCRAGDQRPKFG